MPLLDPQGPCQGRASHIRPTRPRRECTEGCEFFSPDATRTLWEMASDGCCANRRPVAVAAVHAPHAPTPANAGIPCNVGGSVGGIPLGVDA